MSLLSSKHFWQSAAKFAAVSGVAVGIATVLLNVPLDITSRLVAGGLLAFAPAYVLGMQHSGTSNARH